MTIGRPDWYASVAICGKIGDVYVPLICDADGKISVVIEGLSGTIHIPLAVDAAGVIKARMQGLYGTSLVDVALDANGNMIALMKGAYGAALKTVSVDVDGMMETNLTKQTLDFLTTRPVYGSSVFATLIEKDCPDQTETEMFTISGQGVSQGGFVEMVVTPRPVLIYLKVYIDAVLADSYTLGDLLDKDLHGNQLGCFKVGCYDELLDKYIALYRPGISFETSYKLSILNNSGSSKHIHTRFFYALTPY